MRARHGMLIIVAAVALVVAGAVVPSASATGYWNMPSTFCQCMGCGYGPGYHAPMVLGPVQCGGYWCNKEVRLPCPPRPPYGWYGCAGCGSAVLDPSAL